MTRRCNFCSKQLPIASSSSRRYCDEQCHLEDFSKRRAARVAVGSKCCPICGQTKPLSTFSPTGKTKGDGFHSWCKPCRANVETGRRKRPDLIARHRRKYEGEPEFRAKVMLSSVKKRARREGVAVTLTKDWLASRYSRTCELSGFEFDRTGRDKFFAPTIDRIKAGGDYSPENCRMIIWGLNTALCDWGLDRYLMLAKVMVFSNFPDVHEIPTAKLRSVA